MNRTVAGTRLLLIPLVCTTGAWLYLTGCLATFAFQHLRHESNYTNLVGMPLLLSWIGHVLLAAKLPEIARNAQRYLPHLLGLVESFGIAGLFLGLHDGCGPSPVNYAWAAVAFSVLVPLLGRFCARAGDASAPETPRPFFWIARGQVADYDARKYSLIAAAFGAVLLASLNQIAFASAEWDPPTLRLFVLPYGFAWWYIGGIAFMLIQYHWWRALGIAPWVWLMLTIGLAGLSAQPGAEWPLAVLGLAGGLAHSPLLAAILSSVPPRQRFAAVLVQQTAGALTAALLIALLGLVPGMTARFMCLAALAAVGAVIVTWPLLWRPFVELINELAFRPLWMPKGYGPGVHGIPTRGPFLIVGNHAAWFDPVWVAGVLPIRTRALMSAGFLDKPFLKWLCGSVYQAIRVPDEGFRRVTPEIDQAVAALKEGEAVMIFPEGWLRRREEVPLRRFANGVHRILSQAPETPVVACWIEDGWGSFTSFKGGPPGQGKKWDKLKRIRIGVSAPEMLPADVLADDLTTRYHLMTAVLNARSHLGLPPYPLPGFVSDDKGDGPTPG